MSAHGVHLADSNQTDSRKRLVERVASSRHVNRSARLRALLLYLSERVLDDEAGEIHEQEVGHKVFGRPADYDTTSDNIVRVHASMLRKRLEQYFASDGAGETLILEIPKGNYAPIFRDRRALPSEIVADLPVPADAMNVAPRTDWRLPAAITLAFLFACSTAFLLLRSANRSAETAAGPTVRLFWSRLFVPNRATDIVLDDAAVGLFQELSGRSLTLSDYFERGYLRNLPETDSSIVLRRHSSVANVALLWKLLQIPGVDRQHSTIRFARDYSFRELKANNAVLLGNARFNPWVEPFLPKLGIRWTFDNSKGIYYPVDTWDPSKSYQSAGGTDTHDGYFAISLLPNLGGNGNVLIVSATGGSALNAGADFLADESALAGLRSRLPASNDKAFPYFEALINVRGRSTVPRDAQIVLCRVPK
jgi:hypothetical protein